MVAAGPVNYGRADGTAAEDRADISSNVERHATSWAIWSEAFPSVASFIIICSIERFHPDWK
jgi:hypothetical protein